MDAMLPEISNADISSKVKSFLTEVDPEARNSYWLDLSYKEDQNNHIWDSSQNPAIYFEWNVGSPKEKLDQCTTISTSQWMWSDVPCDSKFYALCSWPEQTPGKKLKTS